MKKSFMDDTKSWGKWEDPGVAVNVSAPAPRALPKPLTLADIRVGEEYVTLGRHPSDGRLYSRPWKVVGVPRPHGGIMEIDVQVTTPGGVGMPTSIFAHLYGLGRSFPHNNGYHTFHATPETVALIQDIVARQDHAAYAAIIKEQAPSQDELMSTYWDAPTPPEILGLIGKGILQSLDVAMRTKADAFEPLEPSTKLISLRERRYHLQPPKLVRLDSDEFLREFAKLLKAKG